MRLMRAGSCSVCSRVRNQAGAWDRGGRCVTLASTGSSASSSDLQTVVPARAAAVWLGQRGAVRPRRRRTEKFQVAPSRLRSDRASRKPTCRYRLGPPARGLEASKTASVTSSFGFMMELFESFNMIPFKCTENKAPMCSPFPNVMNVIALSYFLQMSF